MDALLSSAAQHQSAQSIKAANSRLQQFKIVAPGLALSAAVAILSIMLGNLPWLQTHGLGALTIAIVLGCVVGNTAYSHIAQHCGPGVGVAKQTLLRLGIILYGLRLTFQDIGQVGMAGVAIDALVLTSTFTLALLVGTKFLKMERDTVILIGAGSSICGAAAVMACEPVVKAKAEQVTVAVSTVVVLGTLAIFVYPLLYRLNLHWHVLDNSASGFGVYIGSTVHEVAQVVAAARSISDDATNTAVIAKMVRVMMLAPFLLLLSTYLARAKNSAAPRAVSAVTIPWFAIAFIVMVGLHSIVSMPAAIVAHLLNLDTLLLAMAMAALGLSTHVSAVRRAGYKPLMLATFLFGWLIVGGALINRLLA
jgi:uncharacterized integral membrane protein (TIGR00698 family)